MTWDVQQMVKKFSSATHKHIHVCWEGRGLGDNSPAAPAPPRIYIAVVTDLKFKSCESSLKSGRLFITWRLWFEKISVSFWYWHWKTHHCKQLIFLCCLSKLKAFEHFTHSWSFPFHLILREYEGRELPAVMQRANSQTRHKIQVAHFIV